MSEFRCRLCHSMNLRCCLKLGHAPYNIAYLLQEKELCSDIATTVSVYECQECGLVQLTESLDPEYYEDYVMTVSHSPQMRAYQKTQAFNFINGFGLVGKRVIEVGCGDGNYMQYLQEAGAQAVGIEPSTKFREMAQSHGFMVFNTYVTRGCHIDGAPYDAFVTRQVLEHLSNPDDFLHGIRDVILEGGVGLVEVPSLEKTMQYSRFYDFFPDHVNYFSMRTLSLALERNGFEVLEVSHGMNNEYNIAFVRKDTSPDFKTMQGVVQTLSRDIHDFLRRKRNEGKQVAVWGAGGKGIMLLASAQMQNIAYVIDSDPLKQGRFTPVSHIPIVSPFILKDDPVDAVIITAMAYCDEILDQLRHQLQFRGMIAILDKQLRFVQESA